MTDDERAIRTLVDTRMATPDAAAGAGFPA
jgi:hypothetical protein